MAKLLGLIDIPDLPVPKFELQVGGYDLLNPAAIVADGYTSVIDQIGDSAQFIDPGLVLMRNGALHLEHATDLLQSKLSEGIEWTNNAAFDPSSALKDIQTVIVDSPEALQREFDAAVKSVSETPRKLFEDQKESAEAFGDNVKNAVESAGEVVAEKATEIWQAAGKMVKEGISNTLGDVVDIAGDVLGDIFPDIDFGFLRTVGLIGGGVIVILIGGKLILLKSNSRNTSKTTIKPLRKGRNTKVVKVRPSLKSNRRSTKKSAKQKLLEYVKR